MNIFEFTDYKKYIVNWVESQPQRGRGLYKKMAEHMLLSAVTISQVFHGNKDLSLEQAFKLAEFISLRGLKKEYFLLLVQFQRAGSKDLEGYFKDKLENLRKESSELSKRLVQDKSLKDSDKARFYSHWVYSGVRLGCSLEELRDIHSLATRFQIPEYKTAEVVEFLLQTGLCVEEKGKLKMGPQRIHLEAGSPYIKSRQMSWRLKGFERMDQQTSEELFYTAPMSVSKKLVPEIKENLLNLIEKINEKVVAEKPEDLVCLNIDLFKF